MHHLTYAGKNLILGDDAATTLLRYAADLANRQRSDVVELEAIDSTGEHTTASLVIGDGHDLVAETVHSELPEPDNTARIAEIRTRSERLTAVARGLPLDEEPNEIDEVNEF